MFQQKAPLAQQLPWIMVMLVLLDVNDQMWLTFHDPVFISSFTQSGIVGGMVLNVIDNLEGFLRNFPEDGLLF